MKKISRKGFLKIAAAAAMSGVTAGALSACNSPAPLLPLPPQLPVHLCIPQAPTLPPQRA